MIGPFTSLITRKIIVAQGLNAQEGEAGVYDRQELVDNWDQKKVIETKVGVIGQGGLGLEYAVELARMGIGQIEVCDRDDVERSNLSRQRFFELHINMNKAFSAIEILEKECTDRTTLIAYPFYFARVFDEHPDAFSDVKTVACMVDNEETKDEAAHFGFERKIPVVFAGVTTSNRLAAVFVQEPGGPCYNCVYPRTELADASERNQCKYPGVIYSHTAIIGIAVYATTSRIMGWKTYWNEFILSLDSGTQPYLHKKRPGCEICGGR